MNRRTFLTLTAAATVAPFGPLSMRGTPLPASRKGESWDELAEMMACWERAAMRRSHGAEWRSTTERSWIPWNHFRGETPRDAASLVYLSCPRQAAGAEMQRVVRLLSDAGIATLAHATTNCGHVATAFVTGHASALQAVLGDWEIEPPRGR